MSRHEIDAAGPVRPGEEVDAAALERFLARRAPEVGAPVVVEQFRSGHSNLTYLVRGPGGEVVLRRPPPGYERIVSGHDMAREFRVLTALSGVYPRAPRPILFCEADESPLGVPFFLMERVRGVVLRSAADAPPESARAVASAFVRALAELHSLDATSEPLASLGRPDGYLRRQVEGWTARYERARTDAIPEMERVSAWLAANLPAAGEPALVHNDFKYDNLVLDPDDLGRVRAVLDWEMATVGDPLADLGTSLAYWTEPGDAEELIALGTSATLRPGTPARAEIAEMYFEASGRREAPVLYYYALGLMKVAVIAQQIYARYRAGLTRDPRFAGMIGAVRALARAADRAIATGEVSPRR